MPFTDDTTENIFALDDEADQSDQQGIGAQSQLSETPSKAGLDLISKQFPEYQKQLRETSRQKLAIMQEATNKLLARQKQIEEPNWFGIAAALGEPTRTGAFGETLGNVNKVLATSRKEQRDNRLALEDMASKYKIAALEEKSGLAGKEFGAALQLSKAGAKKQYEASALIEQLKDLQPNDPRRVSIQARLDKLNYIPEKTPKELNLEQWANKTLMDEAKSPGSVNKADLARAKAVIAKATYIKPEKDEGAADKTPKAVSPAGKLAADKGFIPGTPEFAAEVKKIIAAGKHLSGTQEKELFEAEDSINAGKSAILALDKALALSQKAYEGGTASARLTAGRHIPGIKSSDAQVASAEYSTLITEQALNSLRAIFGGNPTEGERKILMSLQGSLDMSHAERKPILENAMTAAKRRIQLAQQRMKGIKEGSYGPDVEEKAEGGIIRLNPSQKDMSPSLPFAMAEGGTAPDLGPGFDYRDPSGLVTNNVSAYQQQGQPSAMQARATASPTKDVDVSAVSTYMQDLPPAARRQFMLQVDLAHKHGITLDKDGLARMHASVQGDNNTNYTAGINPKARSLNLSRSTPNTTMGVNLSPQYKGAYFNARFKEGGPVHMAQGGGTDTSGDYSAANFGRAIGQGLGMSFGDEAIARVRSQLEGRPYNQVLSEERLAYENFAKKHPYSALGTELASGLLPTAAAMVVPGGQGAGGANIVRQAPTLKKLAAISGLTGGISGFGAGEGNFTDRLPSAAMGAGTGAVLGPVVAKTANLVGKGYNALKDKLNPTIDTVSQAAMRKVLQAMGRDEMNVPAVRNRMARDQQLGVKSTLADVSPSVTNLAEAAVTVPGKGKKALGQKLENRLEEGRETVGQRTQSAVGKGVDYTQREEDLVKTLRKNAKNVYDQAYAQGAVDDPRIATVLEDNTFKRAYEQARNIIEKEARAAELRGEDPSKYKLQQIYAPDKDGNMVRTGEVPDVRTLDYLKRGIDALIEQGYGSNKSISKAEAGALRDLKNAFVDVIDEIAPAYKTARVQYRGDIEVLDALNFGKTDYLSPKLTPAQAIKHVQSLSQGEKDALRAGAAQSLLGKIMETPNQVNAAQRVIGAPSTRKRLAALFDSPNDYKLFEEALMRESELFRNAQNILRGSRTQMKKEAIDDLRSAPGILDVAGEAVDFANAGPGSITGRVLKFLQSRATVNEKTAGEVANILKSGTPQEINAALDTLEKSAGKFAKQADRSNATERRAARTVGMSIGEPPQAKEPERPQETDEERLQRLMGE